MIRSTLYTFIAALLLANAAFADGLPYSGRLTDSNGKPIVGSVEVQFKIGYDVDADEAIDVDLCLAAKQTVVLDVNGVFSTELFTTCTAPSTSIEHIYATKTNDLFIQLTVDPDGTPVVHSIQRLLSYPFASHADFATKTFEMLFYESGAQTNYMSFRARPGIGSNHLYIFPATTGNAGEVLTTVDGSGDLAWTPKTVNTNAETICPALHYLDGDGTCKLASLGDHLATQDLDMNNNKIINVRNPDSDGDATNRKWVEDHVDGRFTNDDKHAARLCGNDQYLVGNGDPNTVGRCVDMISEIETVSASGLQGGDVSGVVSLSIATGGVNSDRILNESIGAIDLAPDSVDTSEIATAAVTTDEVLNNTLTAIDIADNAITVNELADNSVDTAAIVNGNVTDAKINTVSVNKITSATSQYFTYRPNGVKCSPGHMLKWDDTNERWVCSGCASGQYLDGDGTCKIITPASNTVGSGGIINDSITADDIAPDAITSSELANNSVTSSHVVNETLTAADLAPDSVDTSEIATGAVTSDEVLDNTLTAADIAPNAITASELADNSVDAGAIQTGAVASDEVLNNSLGAIDLAPNSVEASELADNSVDSAAIINGTIVAADLATNSVEAAEIAAGAVGTSEVADNSLTANDLATDSVGALELANNSVNSANVIDNTLTASDLAPNSVGASELANNSVDTASIINGNVTDAKIATVSVNKITSAAGQYFTYRPNNAACSNSQVIKWNNTSSRWECQNDIDTNTNTNASTMCSPGQYLDGSGSCITLPVAASYLDMNGNQIRNVADPTSAQHAATKNYVDTTAILGVNAGTGLTGGGSTGTVTINADTGYLQRRVTGTCAAGSSIRAISSTGTVTCEADNDSGGDITGVTAGTGMSGGGTSGTVTISANTGYLQRRVTGTCAAGSSIRAISSTGTVTCEADNDSGGDITAVAAGGGISVSGGTSGTATVAHADTSSRASINNSGGTVIQDLVFDTYGHVTGATSSNLDGRFVNTSGDTMTGNLTGVAFYYSSDRRLKKLFSDIDRPLERILEIKGLNFTWKKDDVADIGFIAQDIREVFPELVTRDPNTGFLAVKYGNLVAVLVEAMKEQYEMVHHNQQMLKFMQEGINLEDIEGNKREIASLKSEVEELRATNKMLVDYLCAKDKNAPVCK